jgi:recombinational DNA repair protein (RecF pathway)
MHIEHDLGLVLKKTIYQDKKLIVNIYTQKKGLLTLSVIMGRHENRWLGAFEIGQILNLDLAPTKNNYRLHDAQVNFAPLSLRNNLDSLRIWAHLIESIYKLTQNAPPNPLFFEFLKNAIKALDHLDHKHDLVCFIFLKWMQNEGILQVNHFQFLEQELQDLLDTRHFEKLPKMSAEIKKKIDEKMEEILN